MAQEVVKINQQKATKVLEQVDEIMHGVQDTINRVESNFVDLAFLLVEVKRGAYWTLRNFESEHDYVQAVFPQSRAQYYAFLRMGTNLESYNHKWLRKIGRSKCEDLVRLHLHFDGDIPDDWKAYAESDDKNSFRRRVRQYLDAAIDGPKDQKKSIEAGDKPDPKTEDHHITFRIFGDGIHTVNLCFERMKQIVGTEKSMGYLLELLCADKLSQLGDDGTGLVDGKNSFIITTIAGLAKQLDLTVEGTSERLIGAIAAAVEQNTGSPDA